MDAREAERKLDEWVNDDDCVLSFDEKREIRNAIDWERTTLREALAAKDAEIARLKENCDTFMDDYQDIGKEIAKEADRADAAEARVDDWLKWEKELREVMGPECEMKDRIAALEAENAELRFEQRMWRDGELWWGEPEDLLAYVDHHNQLFDSVDVAIAALGECHHIALDEARER